MLDVLTHHPPIDVAKPARSSLYPCFSRADLSCSHGVWLYAADGPRHLDSRLTTMGWPDKSIAAEVHSITAHSANPT